MNPLRDTGTASRVATTLDSMIEVELAYLFGSHARGQERAESDIDLAIQVDAASARDPRTTLARLFAELGRVVRSDRLDIVLLNDAPSLLRHRVLSTGRLLVERTPIARIRFATRTIRDYQDMQVRREFFYRSRLKHLREGRGHGGSGNLLAEARRVAKLLGETPRLPTNE